VNHTQSAEPDREEISVEECRITVDGVSWRYQRAGSGAALVLVHGLLGYSFSWRFALPCLAQHATVYAVDLPGAGFSEFPPAMDCGMRATARRLHRFMDEVGITSCDLLGTSHGGAVAMLAAAQAPERFRRLILVDPVNPWSPRGRFLSVFLSNGLVAPIFVRLAPRLPALRAHYFRRLYGDTRRIRPGTLEGYSSPLRRPAAFAYGIGVLRSWNRDVRELEAILPQISQIPTLLIWGNLDKAVYPESAARLKEQFRDCRLLMLERVGHLPYEEVPEEFHRAVIQFLG